MPLKDSLENVVPLSIYIEILGSMDPEARYSAQEQLQAWLSENPALHCLTLLNICEDASSERQKRRLGAILGEALSLENLEYFTLVGIFDSHKGTIARRAIGYWLERVPVSEAISGICICLEQSLNYSITNPMLDYLLEQITERAIREPDTAFWLIVQKLKSRSAQKHPASASTAAYLCSLLPSADLPRPSNGSPCAGTNLPSPAEPGFTGSRGLPRADSAPHPLPANRRWRWWRR
ncbi:MAG: hypothetical protein QM758_28005 [Armatimonas sp.]